MEDNQSALKKHLTAALATEYWDKKSTASMLGVCRSTLNNWIRKGLIPFYRVGSTYRFSPDEIRQHLAKHFRVNTK